MYIAGTDDGSELFMAKPVDFGKDPIVYKEFYKNFVYLVVSTLLKNMLLTLDHVVRNMGEHKTCLKPPPTRWAPT